MEGIYLSGVISEDCEKRTDKKGHEYIRFKVGCESVDIHGATRVNQYRCFCYNLQHATLKKGDVVFLSGSFNVNEFKGKINFDVYVQQLTRAGKDNRK